MDASSKIGILKALEVECYSICYYVLQQETLATQASKETMQELWSSESFYLQDADHRLKALKQLALRRSMGIYRTHLAERIQVLVAN
ncbi:hypothetical protein O9H85_16730 [Paenibacillus filicis]|uniref:Uncharacterized protein n=1 Tax=Paenibacillus gyeongsangnamensis TaxID=3388067 RepID=A0ABT4QAX2_9BACL|nr:hypothetical protein [Paenibacillus filicis]MCZ8514038.1 hypothetical protein [Paenibacillus filicis]